MHVSKFNNLSSRQLNANLIMSTAESRSLRSRCRRTAWTAHCRSTECGGVRNEVQSQLSAALVPVDHRLVAVSFPSAPCANEMLKTHTCARQRQQPLWKFKDQISLYCTIQPPPEMFVSQESTRSSYRPKSGAFARVSTIRCWGLSICAV